MPTHNPTPVTVYVAADGTQYSVDALVHGVRHGALDIEPVEGGITVHGTFYLRMESAEIDASGTPDTDENQ